MAASRKAPFRVQAVHKPVRSVARIPPSIPTRSAGLDEGPDVQVGDLRGAGQAQRLDDDRGDVVGLDEVRGRA